MRTKRTDNDGRNFHVNLLAGVVLAIAVTACAGSDSVEMEIGPCGNPDIVFDGHTWQTYETIPDQWRTLSTVEGTFNVGADGTTGTFEGPHGTSMSYELVTDEFRAHPCRL